MDRREDHGTDVVAETNRRAQLLQMVRSFRRRIEAEKRLGHHLSSFRMSGWTSSVDVQQERQGQIATDDAPVTLYAVRAELGDCQRCGLGTLRRNLVFGEGNPHAEIVFVGEAPGSDEDLQGRPFVGRAGQLLTKIIAAMKLQRSDVYICNILKCRPPGNRNPRPDEISACEPFLVKQLAAINPAVICALGTFAAHSLLKTDVPITVLRGRFHSYHGIPLMPTYHPAYLLRNPEAKKQVWEDIQTIMKSFNMNG